MDKWLFRILSRTSFLFHVVAGSIALFNENGPCKTVDGVKTKKNPYSWNSNASIIFIDQPAGTGKSFE